MNELVDRWSAGHLVTGEEDLAREFEGRLSDCGTLAVRIAYSVIRNQADAEDVAQEALVRAYRRMSTLRDRKKFRAWLVRVTWRLALDWKRRQRRQDAREDAAARLTRPVGNAEVDAVAADRSARLWAAIDDLPEKLRIVIVLGAIEGHGVREVATLLGIPDGTVKSRLFEARRRLQERLQ